MNYTLAKIFESREDISSYLFHFTKGSNAIETLCKIVKDEALIDINQRGAICFTEAPISLLFEMFKIFDKFTEPMYSPYGIAIKKEVLFKLGGRPIISGLSTEKNMLDASIRWRFEEYIPNVRDFSWLREWRVPQNKISLNNEECFIVVRDKSEISLFFDENDSGEIEFDGCVSDGVFDSYAYTAIKRKFKGVSLEEIEEFDKLSKNEIENLITKQKFDDTFSLSLGQI